MTQPAATPRIPATLIPGDGIGEEIVDATLAALDALQAPFDWDRQIAGLGGVKASGDPLPQATLESIRRTRLALKGPLETPSGGGYRSSNVRLREEFQLYANLRPARTIIPGGRFDKVDLVVVRENLEGLYIGHEHYVQIDDDPHAVAMATGLNTRAGCRRIIDFAFQHAIRLGRKKVTIVHKANIMKALTGIFKETAEQLYEQKYKGQIVMETVIIDACAMKLVLDPWQFDVLVTTNLFGDILSDLVAGLVGGLGMAPGANIGADAAIFEAVHGSAPDIAGQDKANIMKALTGIFLETGLELYERRYKGQFELDTVIIDACAMKLVLNPWQFDMLVTTNLFGDILSDLVAGLVGGLGMAPGANIGADAAIFEAVHGSAPDIAGKGIANPIALMLAAAMMLDHCKLTQQATRLRTAIDQTLNIDQVRTGDLGGSASTAQFTQALVSRIRNG